MKKTAVEWLFDELPKIKELPFDEQANAILNFFDKAKQMEKEQIVESYCQGCLDISKNENIFPRETSEQYYNETFKK